MEKITKKEVREYFESILDDAPKVTYPVQFWKDGVLYRIDKDCVITEYDESKPIDIEILFKDENTSDSSI